MITGKPITDLAALYAGEPQPSERERELLEAMTEIAERDWVENCIDSQWASNRACIALAKFNART